MIATFDLECSFLTGVMHLSVGVTQLVGAFEDKNILLRVDDALSFKVQDSKQGEYWGIFTPVINKISNEIVYK